MWIVRFSKRALKQKEKLPKKQQELLFRLMKDMQLGGPVRRDWPNYSTLGDKNIHHCHLSYSWVACWKMENQELQLIEIYYAGSRENAPY